jgi:molybdopterin-binding protein
MEEGFGVTAIRIKDAAALLGVSDDTVRRWVDSGDLASFKDDSGRKAIAGEVLATFAREHASPPPDPLGVGRSARNRFVGLVTKVTADTVMSEVQMQCGPFTVVSLMSTESARQLGLVPGAVAVAVVKATTVIVETPRKTR